MKFSPETQSLLDRVEEVTNKPIHILPEPSLPNPSQVTMAHRNAPAHFLRYKPDVIGLNYHVAVQCGFVLRLFANPPEERFDFVGLHTGRQSVLNLVAGPGGEKQNLGLSQEDAERFAQRLFDGLMFQVRSIPIETRIEVWLWENYPGLRDEQTASTAAQQQTNAQTLSPRTRAIVPPPVFNASISMNAASALIADRLAEKTLYTIPFRSAGFLDRGQNLVEIFDRLPAEPTADRQLVDAWGVELGLSDWFDWRPFVSEEEEK